MDKEQRQKTWAKNGCFKPGHPPVPGQGRKPKAREERVLSLISEHTTDEDILEVWQSVLMKAKEPYGYVKSQRLFFEYLYGKPRTVGETADFAPVLELLTRMFAAAKGEEAEPGNGE